MRFVFALLIIAFSFSCNKYNYKPSSKELLADEILKSSAIKLRKEKDLRLIGTGGGMMHEVRMLALSFKYYKPVDIEKGRELLVAATNTLADEVNANTEIRKYLKNYPFGPQNIEIRIFLQKPNGSDVDPEELSVIAMLEGNLDYEIDSPETKLFKRVYEETYEEALTKLNEKSAVDI